MRAKHTLHSIPAFPVYSSAFISPNHVVLGGGGGQSKTGIKNKLRLYLVDDDRSFFLQHELELDKGEDAPMSMAAHPQSEAFACGVNSAAEKLKDGANKNCRTYAVKDDSMSLTGTQGTLTLNNIEDDFQKVTVFSPTGDFLAVAGTHDLSLLQYPSLSPAACPVHVAKGEIYDATLSSTTLAVATTANLLIYALPSPAGTEKSKSKKAAGKKSEASLADLQLLKTVEQPKLPGANAGSSYRAVRYHPHYGKVLYTVINTVPSRTRTKASSRRAYICKWDTETWTTSKMRKVSDKGVTCFDVSPNGKFVAFGSSDYTVGILDAQTLAPLLTILKAHDFPPTTLRFNPASSLLVSGSADNTVRIITVPASLGTTSWTTWIILFVTLLVILLAFLIQQHYLWN